MRREIGMARGPNLMRMDGGQRKRLPYEGSRYRRTYGSLRLPPDRGPRRRPGSRRDGDPRRASVRLTLAGCEAIRVAPHGTAGREAGRGTGHQDPTLTSAQCELAIAQAAATSGWKGGAGGRLSEVHRAKAALSLTSIAEGKLKRNGWNRRKSNGRRWIRTSDFRRVRAEA
jgi:hypothetical protein